MLGRLTTERECRWESAITDAFGTALAIQSRWGKQLLLVVGAKMLAFAHPKSEHVHPRRGGASPSDSRRLRCG